MLVSVWGQMSTSMLLVDMWISAATMEIRIEFLQNLKDGQASVAHDCEPSYLGVRDQKDQGLRPARENSSGGPDLKIPNRQKGWGV
jgi:hypothetical protein